MGMISTARGLNQSPHRAVPCRASRVLTRHGHGTTYELGLRNAQLLDLYHVHPLEKEFHFGNLLRNLSPTGQQ